MTCGACQRLADQRRLLVRRKGDIDDLDLPVRRSALRASRAPSGCPSARPPPRPWHCVRDAIADDGKTGFLIGSEMAFGHDHAGADAADPVVLDPHRRSGSNPVAISHLFLPMLDFPFIAASARSACVKDNACCRVAAQVRTALSRLNLSADRASGRALLAAPVSSVTTV